MTTDEFTQIGEGLARDRETSDLQAGYYTE